MYNIFMDYYVFDLAPLSHRMEEALSRLSPDRREKALRLRQEGPRLRSVGAGLLLARFFPGRDVLIAPGGKPYIPGERCFNLSHSGELAVIALADGPVGADVQRLGAASDALRHRVLTREEQRWTSGQGEEGFFFLWTRKEASLKCLGTGVDREMASFDVRSDAVTLDGHAMQLHTVRYGNYMLSAAALGASAAFTPRELTLDELLSGKEARRWT